MKKNFSVLSFASLVIFAVMVGFPSKGVSSTLIVSEYPSTSKTSDLLKSNVDRLIIQSVIHNNYPPHNGHILNSRVGYPNSDNAKNLNRLFEQVQVDLNIDVSAFPSSAAAGYFNSLKENTEASITIRQCLTSNASESRLKMLKKKAEVAILCPTDKSYREALERVKALEKSGAVPNLLITVLLSDE